MMKLYLPRKSRRKFSGGGTAVGRIEGVSAYLFVCSNVLGHPSVTRLCVQSNDPSNPFPADVANRKASTLYTGAQNVTI